MPLGFVISDPLPIQLALSMAMGFSAQGEHVLIELHGPQPDNLWWYDSSDLSYISDDQLE